MKRTMIGGIVAAAALAFATPAIAQDSSYTPSTVWNFSHIDVEPGQFEAYMDYLAGNWRKIQEFNKKEGLVTSYHVFSVNNPRAGEPDLILAVEYKDYVSTAVQEANQRKVEAMMAMDARVMEAGSASRGKMRTALGSMQLQELRFK